ncbi:hypothetical protein PR202_gb04925 [Eleusine coracana subsp. coracana]|uniref:Uncharacterized protein n=1 Tax=Eleusine coracana subsp. coracana TaxID=191504 RepID=A0AAV5E5L3_ELECO|nr:hypothetical protein PR202_gb04925 [Eleusine coracana subsp. coracana]
MDLLEAVGGKAVDVRMGNFGSVDDLSGAARFGTALLYVAYAIGIVKFRYHPPAHLQPWLTADGDRIKGGSLDLGFGQNPTASTRSGRRPGWSEFCLGAGGQRGSGRRGGGGGC